jgi:hypothetical protein
MWAYAIYAAVGENIYKIFGMLIPWFFICGYLFLIPQWNNTATIAASTPIVVNLGRLYGNASPQGDYALFRIEDTIIGVGLGAVLTILIFPVFAVDSLKSNIQGNYVNIIYYCEKNFFSNRYVKNMSLCGRIDPFSVRSVLSS